MDVYAELRGREDAVKNVGPQGDGSGLSNEHPTSVGPEEPAEVCEEEMEAGGSWKEGHRSSGSMFLWG